MINWRYARWAVADTVILLATACSGQPTASPIEAAPTQAPAGASQQVQASVRVVPAQSAELGFLISAPVQEIKAIEGQHVRAGDVIMLLAAPELQYGITAAEAAYTSAERDEFIQSQGRRKFIGDRFVWVGGPPEQRRVAHARTLRALALLEQAQAEYARAVIRAPFEGTVVSVNAAVGEVVQPGRVYAVLGNLTHLQIETTDLSEMQVVNVRIGQKADVRLDALSSPLTGTVASIEPFAGRSPDGDVIYRVIIELDAQPPELLWGMTGDVHIDVSGTT